MSKHPVNTPLNPIKYALKEITTNRFSLKLPSKDIDPEKVIELEIKHNLSPIIKYKVDNDLIIIILKVSTFIQETDEVVMEAETAFVYHALNLKEYLEHDKEKNAWKFLDVRNEALLLTLIGISLSTMRGILHERVRGTILESAPIPILNPANFLKPNPTMESK